MSCEHCGHNDWVTIGNQMYCAHCGETASAAVVAGAKSAPTKPVVPARVIMPTKPRMVGDMVKSSPNVTRTPKPANSFHSGPAVAPAGALDLRAMAPKTPKGAPIRVVPNAATAQPAPPTSVVTKPAVNRTDRAAQVSKSPLIARFTPPVQSQATSLPKTEPQPVIPLTVTAVATAPVAAPPAPPAPEPTPALELPNQVVSQIQAMQSLIPPLAEIKSNTDKSSKRPKAVSIAAAGVAAAIMAGYIWLNNYDSLTIKAAGQKAGISATSPGYLPASFSLDGPISFGNGFVTMQYKSPSSSNLLTINQRKSEWTSSSLLELYVNQKAKNYLSVQTQGLTVYLFDDNKATWVNRGIQYVLEGNSMLSRDQMLKIAESL